MTNQPKINIEQTSIAEPIIEETMYDRNLREVYDKIKSPEVALRQVQKWQEKLLDVAITDVVVDLPTYLHKEYYLAIKSKCDKLVVRIDEDDYVKSKKGPNRPTVEYPRRVKESAHSQYVDLITSKSSGNLDWIKYYRPDIIVKSTTSGAKLIKEIEELQQIAREINLDLQIIILDESCHEVPMEQALAKAVEYDKNKFGEEKFSGSIIERKIQDNFVLNNQNNLTCDL
jgi:bifunctional ADP-heptose synthase (sugar kinase/adenylyltransferase)